jgi:sec-independent protein translocase protein TatC
MEETVSNKKTGKPVPEEKEMSFWDHLEELRRHIIRSAIAIVVFAIAAFIGRKFIFDGIILAPTHTDFVTNRFFCWVGEILHIGNMCMDEVELTIVNLNMSGQFTTHMYISLAAGLVLGVPYIVWEFWRFFRPALKPNERRYARGAVFVISFLFITGVLFGYYLIVPLTINFFGGYQVSELVANQISLTSYISTVVTSTFASGIIFELPVVVFFLVKIGLITTATLKKTRRYMLVVILTLAAIITPPDVFSQILVSIPLYGLFELSIWVAGMAMKKE